MDHTILTKTLIHIWLSTFTLVVLCIAAIQAIFLSIQEYGLRHKRIVAFSSIMPPLEKMELFLFRTITLGFILLTGVLVDSFTTFHWSIIVSFWQKIVLSLFAWFVFGILLLGRYYAGWRGRSAIRWAIAGVFLVTLVYFGSVIS